MVCLNRTIKNFHYLKLVLLLILSSKINLHLRLLILLLQRSTKEDSLNLSYSRSKNHTLIYNCHKLLCKIIVLILDSNLKRLINIKTVLMKVLVRLCKNYIKVQKIFLKLAALHNYKQTITRIKEKITTKID